MSKWLLSLIVTFVFLLLLTSLTLASHIPTPTGFVNDFAGVLTPEQKISLESSLSDFEKSTGNEISVAIIKSLNGEDITDYTVRVFEEWKIGKKGKDNGVLFLIAIDDRKMRLEVGYGLEGDLTDAQAGDIIRNSVAPEFQKGNYYQGVTNGIEAIKGEIKNSSTSPDFQVTNRLIDIIKWIFVFPFEALVTIAMFILYIFSYMARTKSIWLGGIIGIILGSIGGLIIASFVYGLLAVFILGGAGLLLDWYLSRVYSQRLKDHKDTGWWASWGGFSSGKGFSSGSGFGGFGGGRSGGGGASGGW